MVIPHIYSTCWHMKSMFYENQQFSSLTSLSHKEYVTFGDDKKGTVLGTGVIKGNDCFTLNDVTLVGRLNQGKCLFSTASYI
jgi:hypothetical protein